MDFIVKHLCGGSILLAISITTYLLYCGIGHAFLRLRSKKK